MARHLLLVLQLEKVRSCMPDSRDVQRWVKYAKEDYEAAMLVMPSHPRNASFDLQQSAEKYLKAVLIAQGIEPDRTHDLVVLLLAIDVSLTQDSRVVCAAQLLSFVGSRVRYPDRFEDIRIEEAQALAEAATELREFAQNKLVLLGIQL